MFDNLPDPVRVPAKAVAAPTRAEKLCAIGQWFKAHAYSEFAPLRNVERMTAGELAATKTAGTVFAAFPIALREKGIQAPEMPTMDVLMLELKLTQDQIDKIGCACVHQTGVARGYHVGEALLYYANNR